MSKRPHSCPAAAALSVADFPDAIASWLADGECRQLTAATLSGRRLVAEKLLWYLRQQGLAECGRTEIRSFLAYLGRVPEVGNGRWGNERLRRGAKSSTVATYYTRLRAFFAYLVEEEVWGLEQSPLDNLRAPVTRPDQIQPFTEPEIEALLTAARQTRHPKRDEAIVLFLLDTGARVSELCDLDYGSVDLKGRRCSVMGKGQKRRTLPFGARTAKALWSYQSEERRAPHAPLFIADAGLAHGERVTRSGMLQLFERLNVHARIQTTRCSPHTCRHTFAISFLRNGGSMYALMELLGHTTLAMSRKYVALAQADIENQHRAFSPMDRLKRKG